MSVSDILNNVLIDPLLTIYGFAFEHLFRLSGSPGWTILMFSAGINTVLLPLYYQMELAGRRSSQLRDAMMSEIRRIKKHYTGRERYFYIRTIYRNYRYHPIYLAFGSAELFLQIYVFVTVLLFLKNLELLNGVSFFLIKDLSQPDRLLFGINVLPIIMTVANLVSAVSYSEDKNKRTQAFALALLFLVLLYRSPSALVLYWTGNNVFSALKNWVEFKLLRRFLGTPLVESAPTLPRA